jgi:hypothetical protein
MTLALVLAGIASLAMCLGLMRWPSIHWAMAGAYADADASVQQTLVVMFDGLNLYLGNYIGEFLGETLLAAFFLLTGLSQQAQGRYPRWLAWGGIGFALLLSSERSEMSRRACRGSPTSTTCFSLCG